MAKHPWLEAEVLPVLRDMLRDRVADGHTTFQPLTSLC